jgi:shikimate dehydrogenase
MPVITGKTQLFGVIAHPVDHVRAPMVFNPVFEERGIDAVLVPVHILPEYLDMTLNAFKLMPNMGGVAVTIPHKMTSADLCDELGMAAQVTGAVNAIRFEHGRMIGDNFDGKGFVAGLIGEGHTLKGHTLEGMKAVIIGAGGAARAIAIALVDSGLEQLTIVNRSITKADDLADLIRQHYPDQNVKSALMDEIDTIKTACDLLINATSLGLNDNDPLPADLAGVAKSTIIADIIMVPEMTNWLLAAQKQGLTIHLGRHMLDYQKDLIAHFIGAWS